MVILAAVFIAYSLVAGRLDRWSITAPMVFVLMGALLGRWAPDRLGLLTDPTAVKHVAELTLALLLFADASTLRWSRLREDGVLPARLLLVGFPLTVLAGFGLGTWLMPAAGVTTAALMAAILAPTDAALGLGVFTNRSVPGRVRRALNVESGLNDGLATPLVTLFLAALVAEEAAGHDNWLTDAAVEIGIALVVALAVGAISGRLISAAKARQWTSPISERLAVLASGLLAYLGAVTAGGNGFVAAFVAGLIFAAVSRGRLREAVEFTEDLGLFASFLVWATFGALLLTPVLSGGVRWAPIVYALLSLTVVRMAAVGLAMIGTGLRPVTVLFMGWFGPRGLASVVFALIAFETLQHGTPAVVILTETVAWTVFLSVMAHGITSRLLAERYGRMVRTEAVENLGVAAGDHDRIPRALNHSPVEARHEP